MVLIHNKNLRTTATLAASSILLLLGACDIEINNNIPDVPPDGRFVVVGANQHKDMTDVQVGIAIFDDAVPVNLVGGDVVQASTSNDSILLLEKGFYKGSYVASLPNTTNFDQVNFLMVHEPLLARQDRWYPVDLLNIDPGAGEFVGASADISLPPVPLNMSASNSNFSSINDNFVLTWAAEGAGDSMRVRSAVSCTNGTANSTYGTEVVLVDDSDDGSENIDLNQIIYDINSDNQIIKFLLAEARAILQELLIKLSNGAADENFFANLVLINPVDNSCEIRLFLFRHRDGSFDSTSTNGRIFGSRSADINILYNPN